MNRRVLMITVWLLTLVATSAPAGQPGRFGLLLGAVSATQDFQLEHSSLENPYVFVNRWGVDAGVFYEFVSQRHLRVTTELHYVQKGFYQRAPVYVAYQQEPAGSWTNRPRVDYLSVPVLAKFQLASGRMAPYAIVGPRLDIQVGFENCPSGIVRYYSDAKRLVLGGTLGIGLEFATSFTTGVLVEARWSPSMNMYRSEGLTITNESFELLAGMRLPW